MPRTEVTNIKTHTGHPLTFKEVMFIDKYVETGNASQAVLDTV